MDKFTKTCMNVFLVWAIIIAAIMLPVITYDMISRTFGEVSRKEEEAKRWENISKGWKENSGKWEALYDECAKGD